MFSSIGPIALALLITTLCAQARASYLDDVGYTALYGELGPTIPTGAGIRISQVEAEEDPNTHAYAPAHASFPTKSIIYKSGTYPASSHATIVGGYLYGPSGADGGMNPVELYAATSNSNGWLGGGYLHLLNPAVPNVEISRIENHSWIGDLGSFNEEILRRLDFAINRDGFLAVVGVNNGSDNPVPPLLASSYNALSVGRTDGIHSAGFTTADGSGRIKPEIVAPLTATSWTTSLVSGIAGDLLEVADSRSGLADARNHSQVLKAILMAGATKQQLPGWNRTATRPLDEVFGSGQVSLYNSYHILTGGEFAPAPAANLPGRAVGDGWNLGTLTTGSPEQLYFLNVPAGMALRDFSTVLNWNRISAQDPNNLWSSSLANLDLQLMTASNFVLGSTVDVSQSTVDNVEHIYRGAADPNLPATTNELLPGQYALRVQADFTGTGLTAADYALAWRGSLVVENPGAVEVPGDYNLDGLVDGLDFLVWQSNYFQTTSATLLQGDGTGDGLVDGLDFLTWQAGYQGFTASLGMTAQSLALLPEPATALLLLAAAAVLRRRRR